jgi:hypothetical protein
LFSHTGPASGPYYVDDYALGPGGHVYMTESPIYEARSADLNGSTMLSPMDLVPELLHFRSRGHPNRQDQHGNHRRPGSHMDEVPDW